MTDATSSSDHAAELLRALAEAGERVELDAGEVLCREHESSEQAYVIESGAIEATVEGFDGAMSVAVHGPTSIVGEVTTLIGGHRTATLAALERSTVVRVRRPDLIGVFARHPAAATAVIAAARERTDRSRVAALLSNELKTPDGAAVSAIAQRVTWHDLPAGDVLFERGDRADAAFLVVSGRLAIERPREQLIEVGRGGVVGEFGLLDDRERSATVRALRDTTLARLSADSFRALTVDHTDLAMGLVRRILDRSGQEDVTGTDSRVVAVVVSAPLEASARDAAIDTFTNALSECGPTIALDPTAVDAVLNQPGIAETAPGEFGEVRLAELLHQTETDSDHTVLIAAESPPTELGHWSRRILRQADLVVVVTSPTPDQDEAGMIRQVGAAVPKQIPLWLAVLHPAGTERPRGSAQLRKWFDADEVHHLRSDSTIETRRLARLAGGRGIGLILSGGGARGNAHLGVHRALDENDVPIDRVAGSSMGAIVAAGIAQQLSPDEGLDAMKYGSDDLLDYTIPFVSVVKGERIMEVLEHQFAGWDIEDLWVPFSCPSTNLTTAEIVEHREGAVTEAIRASISIPGVLPPVPSGRSLLGDGGILENLPVGMLAGDPSVSTIVASDVAPQVGPTSPGDYGPTVSGWSVLLDKLPIPGRERSGTYPRLTGILLRSMLIGSSRSRDDHLSAGAIDLYLDLDLRGIGLLEFESVDEAARRGYDSSHDRIEQWAADARRRRRLPTTAVDEEVGG
jgi:predicted acylesterase/phospholipase RssA/CRP-like cAMP-binding protein